MGFCIWLRFSLLSPRRLLGQVSVSSRVRTLRRVRCYPYSSSARRRTSLRFWPSRPGTRCGEATSLTRHCCETRPLMTKRTLVLTKSRLPPCARMLIRVSFVLNRRSSRRCHLRRRYRAPDQTRRVERQGWGVLGGYYLGRT